MDTLPPGIMSFLVTCTKTNVVLLSDAVFFIELVLQSFQPSRLRYLIMCIIS